MQWERGGLASPSPIGRCGMWTIAALVALTCAITLVNAGCGGGGEAELSDGCECPDEDATFATEIDRMVAPAGCGAGSSCCLITPDDALADGSYTCRAITDMLWVDLSDTNLKHILCLKWRPDEMVLDYKSLPDDDDSLRDYAALHRLPGFPPHFHFIGAMDFADQDILGEGCASPRFSYTFACNILTEAEDRKGKLQGGDGDPDTWREYKLLRNWVALHEIGEQLGLDHHPASGSCPMRFDTPSSVPDRCTFCTNCATFVYFNAGWLQLPGMGLRPPRHGARGLFASLANAGEVGADAESLGEGVIRVRGMLRSTHSWPGRGKADRGLVAICSVEHDTLVIGEPATWQFLLVNSGGEPVRVYGDVYGAKGGNLPGRYIVEPSGIDYVWSAASSVLMQPRRERVLTLAPGDTLRVTLQGSYYRCHELALAYPGRWGIYGAYYCSADYAQAWNLLGTAIASETDWVDVVERGPLDALAWDTFVRAKEHFCFAGGVCADSIMDALGCIVDEYPKSSYYPYALYGYAICLKKRGMREGSTLEYQRSVEMFERYRREFPHAFLSREALFEIAECLHQMGEHERALAAFADACRADPWNWRAASYFLKSYEKTEPWKTSGPE